MDTIMDRDNAPMHKMHMLVGGAWTDSVDGRTIPIENPANRRTIGEVPRGGALDVDAAVSAATAAFASWRRVPPRDRGRMLTRIADAMEARSEEFARLIALETGNALRTQARPEAKGAAEMIRYFGGLGSELKGETLPVGDTMLSYTVREPLGVVGAIIPWNAPLILAAVKIAPALCAGNTMVLKAADRIVPVSLELGGKSPSVVFPDADEDWVVDGVIAAMRFTRQSQSCTAGSRLFLHADIFDSFLDKLVRKTEALTLGDPLDEATDIGAIINEKQFRKVCSYVQEGLDHPGARRVMGGLPPSSGPLSEGWFALPTVFADVSNDWRLAREEIFGPVLVAIPWRDEAEVIGLANSSHYGLAAYVWTHEIGTALRCAHAIEAGWVQVNQGGGQLPGHSYGGVKQSGIGREFSLAGMLDSLTQTKNVTVSLTTPPRR